MACSIDARWSLGRARWVAALAPAVLICTAASADFNPNLSVQIGNDAPVFAEAGNPYQIILNDYVSSSIPGLHVNNLLIDFRLHGPGSFIIASTSSTVAAGAQWSLLPTSPSDPGDPPATIDFDVTVTADVSGLFPNRPAPYAINTHLHGYYVKVEPDTAGEIATEGTIHRARAQFRGYTLGYLDEPGSGGDRELQELLMGHVDGGLVLDQPVDDLDGHWIAFSPPDAPAYTFMELTKVKNVVSITLGEYDGAHVPVSAEFSVTLIPEPGIPLMLGPAGLLLTLRRRRRMLNRIGSRVAACHREQLSAG